MSALFYTLFNFLLIIICIDKLVSQSVHITLNSGQVIGQQSIVDGKQINVFLGIPYAKPPIGELRFRKPTKIEKYADVVNATHWANACTQSFAPIEDFSEDCLYLNIWSPFDINNVSGTQLKPVMFFIHGGGFSIKSASYYLYRGEVLSTKGDVIVVTINYRLNVFGFFYSGTDDAPGNVGLWDQALALEWVNDNIRYFGGDPNKITIFGESAGSQSVSLHILSPITRNMYQNAIMMSGAVISEGSYLSKSVFKSKWLYRAQQLGCNDTNNNSSDFTPKLIECLRSMDAKKLLQINDIKDKNQKILEDPTIVIDGTFLPDTPLNLFKTGAYKKNVNLLFGTMEDEGSFIIAQSLDPIKYSYTAPQNLSHEEVSQELKKFVSSNYVRTLINGEDVAKVYFNSISVNSSDYDLLRRTIGIALGDYLISCPTILFAKLVYGDSNVYQYHYKSKIGAEKKICSKWMGACHSNDLYPIFGLPFTLFNQSLDEEREESLLVIDFFAHFAKYGYPSAQNGISWPKYYTVNDVVIAPHFQLSSYSNKSVTQFSNQLKVFECDYLFNKYILQQ